MEQGGQTTPTLFRDKKHSNKKVALLKRYEIKIETVKQDKEKGNSPKKVFLPTILLSLIPIWYAAMVGITRYLRGQQQIV